MHFALSKILSKLGNTITNIFSQIQLVIFEVGRRTIQFAKWVFTSQNAQGIINLVLTILLVILAKNTLELDQQIREGENKILAARRYSITSEVREYFSTYIDNAVKLVAYESNKVLLLNPKFAKEKRVDNYVDPDPLQISIESNYLLLPGFGDWQGDSIASYFANVPKLDIDVVGVLNYEEFVKWKTLMSSLSRVTSELQYIIRRLRGSHEKTVILYSAKDLKNTPYENGKFDLRKNSVHLYWVNEIRRHVKQVKENADAFITLFKDVHVDSLRYILKIKSPIPFNKRQWFEGKPYPKQNATIKLDSTYYEFDYYKFYIETVDSTDWPDFTGSTSVDKIN